MTKMLVFELNEFNDDLLKAAATELNLKNIQKALSLNHSKLTTTDTYDSNYLEPWVQWLSVHTGVPSKEHKIKHLGDVPHLSHQQIWEFLSKNNITSGIWGLMNASRNNAKNCLFFVPDPWTFSEEAYPPELNDLIDLQRYTSKNYLKLNKITLLKKSISFLKFVFKMGLGGAFFSELPRLIKNLIQFKGEHFVFISFTDYLASLMFLKYKKKYDPQFSMIFINGLAHLQHHHWQGFDYKKNKPFVYGLKYIDKILAKIFKVMAAEDIFVMLTPLSQINTNTEAPWILYRQIDQKMFLDAAGINFARIEPHMSYDCHLFFATEKDCETAGKILQAARLRDKALFLVETYPENKQKLFYRLNFFEEVGKTETFEINNKKFKFFDLFKTIIHRTGKHIPEGTVYTNFLGLPKEFENHAFYQQILKMFKINTETFLPQ